MKSLYEPVNDNKTDLDLASTVKVCQMIFKQLLDKVSGDRSNMMSNISVLNNRIEERMRLIKVSSDKSVMSGLLKV